MRLSGLAQIKVGDIDWEDQSGGKVTSRDGLRLLKGVLDLNYTRKRKPKGGREYGFDE